MSDISKKALGMLWNSALQLPNSEPQPELSLPSVGESACLRLLQPLLYPFYYLTLQLQSVLPPAGSHSAAMVLLRTCSLINYFMIKCCLVLVPFLVHICDFSEVFLSVWSNFKDWILKMYFRPARMIQIYLVITLESPLDCKEIKPVNPKGNQSWIFIGKTDAASWNSNTLATWCEELTHWKRPWCWERLKAGGEEDDRGWDGWMASLFRWGWVWVSSRSWWWTGKPGVLQSMGLQRVRHDWATELNWGQHRAF